MKHVIIASCLILIVLADMNKQMPLPSIYTNQQPLQKVNIPTNSTFRKKFSKISMEFDANVYQQKSSILQNNHLNDVQAYIPSSNCRLQRTYLELKSISKVKLPRWITKTVILPEKKLIYTNGGEQQIITYSYQDMKIKKQFATYIPQKLSQSRKFLLVTVGDSVYYSNGMSLYKLPKDNKEKFQRLQGFQNFTDKSNTAVKLVQVSNNQFIYYTSAAAKLIKIQYPKVVLQKEIVIEQGFRFQDIVHSSKHNLTFILGKSKIYILKNFQNPQHFPLEADGIALSIKDQTLHLVSKVNHISFIAEFLLTDISTEPKIILNRYYDELTTVSKVRYAGQDKLMLLSDDQMIIMNDGIPRSVLSDMTGNKPIFTFMMDPLIDIINVMNMDSTQYILSVDFNQLEIFEILSTPPILTCFFESKQLSEGINLLVAFNTSHCQQHTEIPNPLSVCQNFYKFQVRQSLVSLDKNKFWLMIISIVAIVISISACCIGFTLSRIQAARVAMYDLSRQISKAKSKKSARPI